MKASGLVRVAVAAGLLGCAAGAAAQDRPFVFSVTTATAQPANNVVINYDVGAGERTFHANTGNGPEQRVGVQASVGRWTLLAHVGLASIQGEYETSQQGEVLYSIARGGPAAFDLAVGGGVLREASGVNVALARIVAGRSFERSELRGNVVFQKPMAADRDAVDLLTSVGWTRRVTSALALGVEAVGEDLEGFWEPEEAEGGARLLFGPSVHIAPPRSRWQISVAGGPTLHPTTSNRESGAVRDLPPTTRAHGYAVRSSFSVTF
jgi:hypothetical protein